MKVGQGLAPSFCTGGQGRWQEAMGEGLGGESIWQSRSQQGGIRTIVRATQRAGKHATHTMQKWPLAGKGSVGTHPAPI